MRSQMTSPAMKNRVWTVRVYHFTHFYHLCKSNFSPEPSQVPFIELVLELLLSFSKKIFDRPNFSELLEVLE